jgi:hypothetical protein
MPTTETNIDAQVTKDRTITAILDAFLNKIQTNTSSLDAIIIKGGECYLDAKLNKSLLTITPVLDAILIKYEVFPWDSIELPNGMEITEFSHTVKHNYQGYSVSRATTTKVQKQFTLTWNAIDSASWLKVVEFWRLVHGNADAFYFQFPVGIYGVSGYGGEATTDDLPYGFESEYDFGYGSGAVFLVTFVEDNLKQKWVPSGVNRWKMQITVREV